MLPVPCNPGQETSTDGGCVTCTAGKASADGAAVQALFEELSILSVSYSKPSFYNPFILVRRALNSPLRR